MHFSVAFTNIFEYVKTANVQCDNVKPIPSGALTLPATHSASINHITALCILNFILRAKDCCLLL